MSNMERFVVLVKADNGKLYNAVMDETQKKMISMALSMYGQVKVLEEPVEGVEIITLEEDKRARKAVSEKGN